jgi:hypothetical protein
MIQAYIAILDFTISLNPYSRVFAKIIISHRQSGRESMSDKLAEVEISKDGEIYFAKILLPSGEVITLENEDFEEVLEQVANDLQERYSN